MPGVPTDSSNLVVRAINLVREKTNMEHVKFSVDLDKTCPAQAGLGGGSGNAGEKQARREEDGRNEATAKALY